MWWTIPLVIIIIFIFVGIPLILDYRAENVEKSIRKSSNVENSTRKTSNVENSTRKTSEDKKRIVKIILLIAAIIAVTVIGTLILNDVAFKHTEGLVYRTRTGDCYHTIGCGYLRSQIPMGIEQARDSSLRACSRCGGIPKGTIEVNNYAGAASIVFLIEVTVAIIGFVIYDKTHPDLHQ